MKVGFVVEDMCSVWIPRLGKLINQVFSFHCWRLGPWRGSKIPMHITLFVRLSIIECNLFPS
jgi:hypothetical protein